MRLNKFLSQSRFCSRRKADELIAAGRVKINNRVAIVGEKVNEKSDDVKVDGKRVYSLKDFKYWKLYKPKGYECSTKPSSGNKSVYSLDKRLSYLAIVGRLDVESEGLVILTNDGDLNYRLTHPKFENLRIYEITIRGKSVDFKMKRLEKGIGLSEGWAKFDKVEKLGTNLYQVSLHQGWNRQVRRMLGKLYLEVLRLKRIEHGSVSLAEMKSGDVCEIKDDELENLVKLKKG